MMFFILTLFNGVMPRCWKTLSRTIPLRQSIFVCQDNSSYNCIPISMKLHTYDTYPPKLYTCIWFVSTLLNVVIPVCCKQIVRTTARLMNQFHMSHAHELCLFIREIPLYLVINFNETLHIWYVSTESVHMGIMFLISTPFSGVISLCWKNVFGKLLQD